MADLAESIMKNLRRVHPISTMIKVGLCSNRFYLNAIISCSLKEKKTSEKAINVKSSIIDLSEIN